LRYAYYGANNLNQYTSRTAPGSFDVIGTATNSSTVTVNNQGTSRKADYYRGELSVDNSSAPLYLSVTNVGVVNNGLSGLDIVTNKTGNFFLPQTPESFKYDADGNLTNDGRWSLQWDAENRLVTMTANANVPAAALKKLDFGYDYRARRITKKVSTWTGSNYVVQSTNKFVYDDWNLITEVNNTNSVIRSYSWGLDLSGTIQGAGGVGGLTAVNIATNGAHFTAFDGNGNVRGLVSATNGAISAQYEYGPFGETLRAEGAAANSNPCRFSTKFTDDESDFLYYGFRYDNPSTGRWPNRDPIGERGGRNLYAIWENDAINNVDSLGLQGVIIPPGGGVPRPSLSPIFPGQPIPGTSPINANFQPQRTPAEDFAIARYLLEVSFQNDQSPWVVAASMKSALDALLGAVGSVATLGSGAGKGGLLGYTEEVGNVSGIILLLVPVKGCPGAKGANRIEDAAKAIEDYLGGTGKVIRNADGDAILLRGDKKIRFDIIDPHGDAPHFHLEQQTPNGTWTDAGGQHRYYFNNQ